MFTALATVEEYLFSEHNLSAYFMIGIILCILRNMKELCMVIQENFLATFKLAEFGIENEILYCQVQTLAESRLLHFGH